MRDILKGKGLKRLEDFVASEREETALKAIDVAAKYGLGTQEEHEHSMSDAFRVTDEMLGRLEASERAELARLIQKMRGDEE